MEKAGYCFVSQYCENVCNGDSGRTDNGNQVAVKMKSLVTGNGNDNGNENEQLGHFCQRAIIASGDITESNPFKSGQLASNGNTLQPIVVQINCLSIFAVWRKN